jgi:type II secretory pathway pseudopilin PulG
LRKCSALELSHGVLSEQSGELEEAILAIHRLLRFSASLEPEPDLISVLVQDRIDSHASELLRWLLNHRQLSKKQLEQLHTMFQTAVHTNRLEQALVGDRCCILATFDYSAGQILDSIDPGYEKREWAILGIDILKISGTLKKDELRFLDRLEEARRTLELPFPERLDLSRETRLEMSQEARPKKFILTGVLFSGFFRGIEKNAQATARHRLVLAALALERYRAGGNTLPESLSELTPAFLPEVPNDPFTREQLFYRRQELGYVLYSVGPDREDDEGAKPISRESKLDSPKGDIIFAVER